MSKNCIKGLRFTKVVKQIKLEEVCGELESRNCFQRQWFKKYLRQTLGFMWNRALRQSAISVFQDIFASTDKIFILGEGLSTRQ